MSNCTRDYRKDFDYRVFGHTASASQFDSFLSCPRKWWFQKVIRLPDLANQLKFEFGDVLHEACERFLDADDQGRDRDTGEALDLWPEGWNKGLGDFDASLVKRLVEKGIEEGVLRRMPDREIEAPIGVWNGRNFTPRQMVPGVGVCGYRDVKSPGVVEDHKSVKSRGYCKSQADLLADPQMLLYAAIAIIELAEAGEELPETVLLRHNQFVKNPDDLLVKAVEVDVELDIIQEFWEKTLEPAAADMLRYKKTMRDETKWSDIEGPRAKGACQSYGGCPFARICGRAEHPVAYRARIDRINAIPAEPEPDTITKENNAMGIFNRLDADKKKPAPAKPVVVPIDDVAVAVIEEAVAEQEAVIEAAVEAMDADIAAVADAVAADEANSAGDVTDVPPWASDDCPACKGSGFNKKGKPCAACDRIAEKEGSPRVSSFTSEVNDGGETVVTRTADDVVVAVAMLQVAEVKKTEKTKPAGDKAKKTAAAKRNRFAPKEDATVAPEADAERVETTTTPPPAVSATIADVKPDADKTVGKGRKGRSATGFVMVYGAVRRSKMKLLDLNEIFARYAAELAAAQGADSYYRLDRFKRRDMMAASAEEIAETIPSSSLVVVRADDPDIRAFATAIEVYATNVIEGIA